MDPSGEVLVLPQFCPWAAHLTELEPVHVTGGAASIKFTLYADSSSKWRIQAVPAAPGSFDLRLGLPEPWRGIRDQQVGPAWRACRVCV